LADGFFEAVDLDITWITLDRTIQRPERHEIKNQTFVRIPEHSPKLNLLLKQWPTRLALRRALADCKPDIVHIWGTECFYAVAMEDISVPIVLSVQGCLTAFNKVWKPSRAHKYLANEEARRFAQADVVVCESAWSAEQVQAIHPPRDLRVIEYGVHPVFYAINWEPSIETPNLIYSGSLDIRKGADLLFDALELIPNRSWRLKVCGHGPLETELRNRGLPNVDWLGVLRWSELRQHLSSAWGLVVPTRADTGPTVVKEARVVGLPVIGSVNGGLRDYIKDGSNGLIVNPLNPRILAEKLAELMSSFERMKAMGAAGHQEDRAFFSSQRTVTALVNLYRERLAR
jgi:glycosyltransferase involved in cell wall biosynthesis